MGRPGVGRVGSRGVGAEKVGGRGREAALDEVKDLRETIYRIFAALAAGRSVPSADLAALNRWLGASLTHLRAVPATGGYGWGWEPSADPRRLLWPVVWSAAGLLVNLGDAPYTATKHAAVGVAEWLSITHGAAGL